ncbi:aspartyl protease family protein [Portibacter marinus]|uniref:aspartyl protease family protein n=1 Tax=Portibacter marinus TaxID=2898660 RepID=UPI001F1EF2A2|nr:aspartyl protease family protein [Portibacter marinus]
MKREPNCGTKTNYWEQNELKYVRYLSKELFKLRLLTVIILTLFSLTHVLAQFPGRELLRGRKHVEVPFEYIQGFIVLNVDFNRFLPLKFIFDTGAENTLVLKKEITDLLGMEYSKKISLIGSDLSNIVFAYITRNVNLKFENSGRITQDILVLEDDLNNLDMITGTNIDGIIGASIFKNLVVEIDYRRSRLIFHDPQYYTGPNAGFTSFDLKVVKNKPYMECYTGVGVNDSIKINLLLDTGASLNYLLHENTHEQIDLPEYVIPGQIGTGISGSLQGFLGKVNFLTVGQYKFERLTTSFQNLDSSVIDASSVTRNGIIGNRLLERFTVVIDYPNEKIHMKPRRFNFTKPFRYDKSGLIIFAIGRNFDKFYIKSVIEGTPAYLAGLQPGDYILGFNGIPTRFLSLESINRKLSRKPGKKINLTIARNSQKLKFSFRLEDFLEKNIK